MLPQQPTRLNGSAACEQLKLAWRTMGECIQHSGLPLLSEQFVWVLIHEDTKGPRPPQAWNLRFVSVDSLHLSAPFDDPITWNRVQKWLLLL